MQITLIEKNYAVEATPGNLKQLELQKNVQNKNANKKLKMLKH